MATYLNTEISTLNKQSAHLKLAHLHINEHGII